MEGWIASIYAIKLSVSYYYAVTCPHNIADLYPFASGLDSFRDIDLLLLLREIVTNTHAECAQTKQNKLRQRHYTIYILIKPSAIFHLPGNFQRANHWLPGARPST
jgi:hypothetical protein